MGRGLFLSSYGVGLTIPNSRMRLGPFDNLYVDPTWFSFLVNSDPFLYPFPNFFYIWEIVDLRLIFYILNGDDKS